MMLTKHEINSATADQEEAILSICDWCIEPILLSDPHYACAEGDYFLHKTCYQFPDELQTPKHPEHLLTPMTVLAVAGNFRCHACLKEGSCLYYECKSCKFYICIKCVSASLTSAVLHNSHKHLLTQVENTNRITCNACGVDRGSFGFGCEDCHFYLDYECALMPPTTKQKWDEHMLVLSYPPFVEHPDEFCCVICDLQMNPNEWMYHCHECDQSFHPWCIPQIHQNTKFGRAMYVDEHSHPLTHIPEAYDDAICHGCDNNFDDGEEAFQCTECSYCLRADCACKREVLDP
ncbi:protein VACUOLELESS GAMETOPHYTES-like [Coffea arabica]|uniref:Protein VACUOLELESS GAMETOPHYTES-like n=1 Tax=Coffea arabica TaxID=13443 RepID=A0A6P6TWP4_COFAR|nr:uncharacterized protein LOC113704448 [Coffea arabica]